MAKKYKTIHSLTHRPSLAQIISYILFIAQILTFYFIISDRFDSLIFLIVYSTSIAGQFILTAATSLIDPVDPFIIRQEQQEIQSEQLQNYAYCKQCEKYVDLKTRHCKVCKRCVKEFDHHCIWINNCIGGRNYKTFISMIILTFSSMTLYLTGVIHLWANTDYSQFLSQMILLWIVAIVIIIFDFLLLNLILLHIYLIYRGITTYQLILQNRQEQAKQRNISQIEIGIKHKQLEQIGQSNHKIIKIKTQEEVQTIGQENIASDFKSGSKSFEQPIPDDSESYISNKIGSYFAHNRSLKILMNNQSIEPIHLSNSSIQKGRNIKKIQ